MPYITYQDKMIQHNNHYVSVTSIPPFDVSNLFNDIIHSLSLGLNNKIYVGGNFTLYQDASQRGLIRLNLDGTKDASFDIGAGFYKQSMSFLKTDSSDRIYGGGNFTLYQDVSQNHLIRLNPDGSKDDSFDIGTGFNSTLSAIFIDLNNKIYIGGNFFTYQNVSQNHLIRLNPDGSKDDSFDIGTGFNRDINSIIIDSSNKIYAGGGFTLYKGLGQNCLIRLNSDGTKDTTFDISSGFFNSIFSMVLDSSGHIYVGGNFTAYQGLPQNRLIRLNPDGSKDTTFDIGTGFNGDIYSIYLDPNNKLYIAGSFTTYKELMQNSLIRLNSDGSKDELFDIGAGFNSTIYEITVDSNNKIYVGGAFTTYKGLSQRYLVKLDYRGNKI
jgi:uncharacterized delta-60 repeat protein